MMMIDGLAMLLGACPHQEHWPSATERFGNFRIGWQRAGETPATANARLLNRESSISKTATDIDVILHLFTMISKEMNNSLDPLPVTN